MTQLDTTKKPGPLDTVRGMLEQMKGQIRAALPRHMTADRLIRVALTSVQKNPALLDCAPVTLIGAIVQCAQLGLEPDDGTGKAYLVPFNNTKKNRKEVQFIAGYRGLIDLARRSGQVTSIEARVVHAKDQFAYSFGLTPVLDHTPTTEAEAGPAVYFYAVARFKDGAVQFDVMTRADVDKIRTRSRASQSGPWVTDYDEMGKKTVSRRLCKMLPMSTEYMRLATLDERGEIGLPQDLGMVVDATEAPTVPDEGPAADAPPIDMPQEKAAQAPADPADDYGDEEAPEPAGPAAPATGFIKMMAKRAGKCSMCGKEIKVGTPIVWDKSNGAAFHADCA